MDADLQQSLLRHRQREMKNGPDVPVPWKVFALDTSDEYCDGEILQGIQKVANAVAKMRTVPGNVIVDCPGNLNDPALKPLIIAADVIVIPMRYDSDTVDATAIYVNTVRQISKAKLFFIPNRIVVTEERKESIQQQRDSTVAVLGKWGGVTPRIKQGVAVQRYTTLATTPAERRYATLAVENSFEYIINKW